MQLNQLTAISFIVQNNPVCQDSVEIRKLYRKTLRRYIRDGGWTKRKYVASQMKAYEEFLKVDSVAEKIQTVGGSSDGIAQYKVYLLVDLLLITGLDSGIALSDEMRKVMEHFYRDFYCTKEEKLVLERVIQSVNPQNNRKKSFSRSFLSDQEKAYIDLMQENVRFLTRRPYRVLVTATMSAGKSTFINALAGKYISLAQNMACTSKIHTIIGKPFEDGCTCEYDHELVMMARQEELLSDNEENAGEITVSTYLNGSLGGERMIIRDSPGVNFSGETEHREITNRMIRGRKYDLLIYVMNATQLGTVDEATHLDYVRSCVGRTPVLFVVNKVDEFKPDEGENIGEIMEKLNAYLRMHGFRKPQICPISSHAAWLSKKAVDLKLNHVDQRTLYNYIDKFEEMELPEYYGKYFPEIRVRNECSEEERLLKMCGFAYVERLIKRYAKKS
ncbi:MAG: dynamin family protein [Clostridiales bacterium]|nr:dynamin family protein [Clostridiales bacterium]